MGNMAENAMIDWSAYEKQRVKTINLFEFGLEPFTLENIPAQEMGYVMSQLYDDDELHEKYRNLFDKEMEYRELGIGFDS